MNTAPTITAEPRASVSTNRTPALHTHHPKTSHTVGFVLVTVGAVLWGTGGIAGTVVAANSDMSWLAISALRLLAGGILMLIATASTGELRRIPRNRGSAQHIVLTAVLVAIFGGAYFQAVAMVGVAVATVLALGTAPLVVAITTAVQHRKMPRLSLRLALLAAMTGLVLVVDLSQSQMTDTGTIAAGTALAVLSGVAFGCTTIINRHAVAGLSPANLIATSFTLAGLISLPWGVAAGIHIDAVTPTAWWAMAFLAIVQTVLGYLSFYAGLHRGVQATSASILSLIELLTATVLAVLLLHESLSVRGIIGIALILMAVILVRPEGGAEGARSGRTRSRSVQP